MHCFSSAWSTVESHELLQHPFYSLSRRENLSHILFSFFPHVHQPWQRVPHGTHVFVFCFFPLPCLSHMIFWLNCLSLPASTSVLSPTVYVALLSGRLYMRKCLFSLATSTAKNIFSPIEQRRKNRREGTDEEEEGRAVLYKASARGSSLWFKSICRDAWRLNCEYKTGRTGNHCNWTAERFMWNTSSLWQHKVNLSKNNFFLCNLWIHAICVSGGVT